MGRLYRLLKWIDHTTTSNKPYADNGHLFSENAPYSRGSALLILTGGLLVVPIALLIDFFDKETIANGEI